MNKPPPVARHDPLRVMFCVTSLPIGGAETLLVNLVRRLDRRTFAPEICCLKEPGPLGDELAGQVPLRHGFTSGKYDMRVLPRLGRLFRQRRTDAVVTVGAGDKMFWGRIAARISGVRVVCSALHSTGWPDGVGRLNRLLTPWTDAFIAVAKSHGRHLIEVEGFPARKVVVIPNGVDTQRFAPSPAGEAVRRELGIGPAAPVVGLVAALRAEKNHEMFLEVARRVHPRIRDAVFLIVGDGPRREDLEQLAARLGVGEAVRFLGARSDVPQLLSAMDVVALTSHNEANPVSILEAMSAARPVVATDVGSVGEAVASGRTGFLVPGGNASEFTARVSDLLNEPLLRRDMGRRARRAVVEQWSLGAMVAGYERLLTRLYTQKTGETPAPRGEDSSAAEAPALASEAAGEHN